MKCDIASRRAPAIEVCAVKCLSGHHLACAGSPSLPLSACTSGEIELDFSFTTVVIFNRRVLRRDPTDQAMSGESQDHMHLPACQFHDVQLTAHSLSHT